MKLPGTKFATTVQCSCSNATVSQLHRVPCAMQTFAEGSAAAKTLKNTDVKVRNKENAKLRLKSHAYDELCQSCFQTLL